MNGFDILLAVIATRKDSMLDCQSVDNQIHYFAMLVPNDSICSQKVGGCYISILAVD